MIYRLLTIALLLVVIIGCDSAPTPAAPTTTTSFPTATRVAPSVTPTTATSTPSVASLATPAAVNATPTTQTTTRQWNFDGDTIGALPAGMVAFSGQWAVRAEADAPSAPNALCQTGRATYPALQLGDTRYGDVVLTTRFKPISGQVDRAGGLIFRVQNKDNFYILRANALEDNVNFYTFIGGQRSVIKEGSAKVASGQWHELRAEMIGNRMRGFLDGQLVVETTDNRFAAPGAIGLWTKEDSVTCFDNVAVSTP
ncbi:MAG: family 16 glycoside hydrolase [Chloroflexota bacterium]